MEEGGFSDALTGMIAILAVNLISMLRSSYEVILCGWREAT
jgi:hypothetical protein